MNERNKIIYELFTPCETLFVLANKDPKTIHIKKFLNDLKEDTDNLLSTFKEYTYKSFIKSRKRPYLFELIRYDKEELINKNFSKRLLDSLDKSLNELGFCYGIDFTKEDLIKLTILSATNEEKMFWDLSINKENIKK